jgi:NodT family efflux transporter outer membrane factor (OMF) lipoprotein
MNKSFSTNTARDLAAAALLALVTGCAVGPDYSRPALPAMDRYTEAPLAEIIDAGAGNPQQRLLADTDLSARWWELFKSAPLDELVRSSLANSPTVAGAQAALRVALENVRAQQGAYYPSANVGYTGSRQKIADPLASPASDNSYLYNLHTAQLTVSYTPDVFGANRRQVESLQAQADSQRWTAEATYLTLTANVVAAAVQEGSLRAQIDATRKLVAIQQDVLKRFGRLRELGQVSLADVAQQEASLAATEANLPPLDKQLAQQRDLIKALSGRMPAELLDAEFTLDSLTLPEQLPLTLPSTLVEHRPDVLAAEEQLHAASAEIGVAVANRLPNIVLGVNSWGSSAYSLADLFRSGTSFWTLTGGITQTIFDAGALQHRETAARAAYEQATAQYRSTVLNAFQNVADSLQAIEVDANALRIALRAQEAADRSLTMARRQLELGDVSALVVMQAQQSALQATIGVVQAKTNRLSDTVALFQSLGGGWWNRQAPLAAAARP